MKCVGRFGLGYTHDVFIFARHMFMHFSCIRTFFFLFLVSGYDVFYVLFFSFLPLSLYRIDCIMAPKCKSTPAQKPLHGFGSSTSSNLLPPLHVQFPDEKAQKDFLENFQRRGVHSECQVILSNYIDTPLPIIIRTRGWDSLFEKPLRCPIVFIQEFYSNIHGVNTTVPKFVITFKGTHIVVTSDLISKVLHVPRVAHPDYPGYTHLQTMSKDKLLSHFYKRPSIWGEKQNTSCMNFAKGPRFLNIVMIFTLTLLSHYNSITESCARFLLSLLNDLTIDFPFHFIISVLNVYQDTATCDKLIFPFAITRILRHFSIEIPDSPHLFPTMGAIDVVTIQRSKAKLRPK